MGVFVTSGHTILLSLVWFLILLFSDPKLGEKKKKIILMFPFFAPVVLFF